MNGKFVEGMGPLKDGRTMILRTSFSIILLILLAAVAHAAEERAIEPEDEDDLARQLNSTNTSIESPVPITADDLYYYPDFYIANGTLILGIVVGSFAPTSDIIGAIEIASSIKEKFNQSPALLLSSQISNPNKNLIMIGNVCQNSAIEKISSTSNCQYNLERGQGILQLFNNNGHVQIIASGYSGIDVRRATRVLAEWDKYKVHGTKLLITGTTLSDINVTVLTPTNTTPAPSPAPATPTDDLLVEIKVDGDKVSDGDSVKLKLNKEFNVKVELENRANTTKDVEVEADLDDLNQDDEDSVTLEKNEGEKLKFDFDIPKLTDDDEYDLEITVNDGKTRRYDITLKIDKPSHELSISDATLTPEAVPCEENTARLDIRIDNTGKDDEEGALSIESGTLKLKENNSFEISQGESQLFSRTINAMTPGEHNIGIKAKYGSRNTETSKKLTVNACKKETTIETQASPAQSETLAPTANQKMATVVAKNEFGIKEIVGITAIPVSLLSILAIAYAMLRR